MNHSVDTESQITCLRYINKYRMLLGNRYQITVSINSS